MRDETMKNVRQEDRDLSAQLLDELREATTVMLQLQEAKRREAGSWPWKEALLAVLSAVCIALGSWLWQTDRAVSHLQSQQLTPIEKGDMLRSQTILSTQMTDVQRRLRDIEQILRENGGR